jgi:hypothetical protein
MAGGFVVWITGPEEAAIERVASAVAAGLARRTDTELLTCATPGMDLVSDALARAAAAAAVRLAAHGIGVVVAVPGDTRALRDAVRAACLRAIEVYVPSGTPRAGYEPPDRPEVEVDSPQAALEGAIARTLRTLEVLGHLPSTRDAAYSEQEEREVIRRLKSFGYI